MDIKEILNENTDEIIAIGVVLPTIGIIGYQAVIGAMVSMPTEPLMLILGYYFGKKVTQ